LWRDDAGDLKMRAAMLHGEMTPHEQPATRKH